MFTDMVGYSAMTQHDDKLALELLKEHRRLLRDWHRLVAHDATARSSAFASSD
jgi:hypothetical protein